MPQMMPLSWLLLFLITMMTSYLIMMFLYFLPLTNLPRHYTLNASPQISWNWKW